MENSNFIIRIPEPCHEDWNKMQPDAKGKFCGSCSKSVFDFSNKTDNEIRDILIEYKDQKVCGHFKKTQLDRPLIVQINLRDLPVNMSSTKVFAISLFLVFGTFLFSCTNEKNQKISEIKIENIQRTVGEMQALPIEVLKGDVIVEPDSLVKTTSCENKNIGGAIEEMHVSGGMRVENINIIDEPLMTGEIEAVPEDSIKGKTKYVLTEPNDTAIIHAVNTLTTSEQKIESLLLINEQPAFSIYPNPGNGEFTISYDVLKRTDVKMDIFDLRGALVRTVVDVTGQYAGKYQIPFVLNELPNGVYIVSLINNGKQSSKRIVIEK